jgi:DNA-binding NtrC family response regulator
VKLLRFLQDGLVTPLGSDKTLRVSVRVIAATHRNLKERVARGEFREDLYYRLAGYEITVPALRERRSDLPLLVEHFRARLARELRRDAISPASRSLLALLENETWPGNVRQLEQVLRRTIIDSGGLTDAAAAAEALRAISTGAGVESYAAAVESPDELGTLDEAERRHIIAVLRATGGNQTQAAYILGIERKTLARKMKRLDISNDQG